MTSPDVTPYYDLRLYDTSAQQLFDGAMTQALVRLPGWQPLEGDTAVVLLEALSWIAAEGIFAINRLPAAVIRVLLGLFGVTLDVGAQATSTVSLRYSDGAAHNVPAGTMLQLDMGGPAPLLMTTTAAAALPAGGTSVTVGVVFTAFTGAPNNVAAGTALQLVNALVFLDSAALAATPAGGRYPESDASYFSRATQILQRLVATFVLPVHFQAAALQNPAVFRAHAIDNYDPTVNGSGTPGLDGGHVTVAVLGPNSVLVGAADKSALLATLQAGALANLTVHLVDPQFVTVDVSVTVMPLPGYGPLATPKAPGLAAQPTGSLAAGTYTYRVTRTSASGETLAGPVATITTSVVGGVQVVFPAGGGVFNVYGRVGVGTQLAAGVSGQFWADTGAAGGVQVPPTVDTSSPLTAAITAALSAYLSPAQWDWSGSVRRNKLIQVVSGVPGVDYVETLTPAADVVVAGVAPIVQGGAVVVSIDRRP